MQFSNGETNIAVEICQFIDYYLLIEEVIFHNYCISKYIHVYSFTPGSPMNGFRGTLRFFKPNIRIKNRQGPVVDH